MELKHDFSRALLDKKNKVKSPLLPGDEGGDVVTNDWCINLQFTEVPFTYFCS